MLLMPNPRLLSILILLVSTSIPACFLPVSAGAPAPVEALFEKKIAPYQKNDSALTYHAIPINSADIRSKESLVELKDYGIAADGFYSRKDKGNAPYYRCVCPEDTVAQLRESVAEKLKRINSRLSSIGLELYVFDAYRPVSCQKELWKYFMAQARRTLGDVAQAQLIDYAGKFCSNPEAYDPSNYQTWPTHLSGGAVDLTLRRKDTGELLFMGSIFDDASELSFTAYFEGKPDDNTLPASYAEARRNRRLLYWIMVEEGFANYPNEWWHFDFGTQMWVQNRSGGDSSQAFYGAI